LGSFIQVSLSCAFGVFIIATAVTGFFLAPMGAAWRMVAVVAGLLLVAPSLTSDLLGLVVFAPIVASQVLAMRRQRGDQPARTVVGVTEDG
jgi:TRAP-type uncharacterized transport system fused permease subunit